MPASRRNSAYAALALAAALTLLGLTPGAHAQPASVKSAKGDDLRALYATTLEVAEGKRVAETSCARCHGLDGISNTKGLPHLAGQRAAYIHLELKAYKAGVRSEKAMEGVVKFLSEDALIRAAAYYASLDPAPPPAPGTAKPAAAKPDAVQAGKAASAGCAGCHGETGISKTPGMPSMVALDPKYLVAAMKGYKTGQRKHEMMKSLLGPVSDADMENIALYYALQKPARAQAPVTGKAEAGKAAAGGCAGCHGEQGVSGSPANPSLAGQDEQYLVAAIKAYKDGSRSDATMKGLVAGLDDGAIKALAAFYATQTPQPVKFRRPLAMSELIQRCDRCHGINGNSTEPLSPALAGQRADYMEKVLQEYRKRVRKSPAMAAMTDGLTDADIENLAAHYARQKARSVVFVIPPAK